MYIETMIFKMKSCANLQISWESENHTSLSALFLKGWIHKVTLHQPLSTDNAFKKCETLPDAMIQYTFIDWKSFCMVSTVYYIVTILGTDAGGCSCLGLSSSF